MPTDSKAKDIRELLDSQGRLHGWVAAQVGASRQAFTQNILNRGRATEQERAKLAEVLGLSIEEIAAALAETARRAEGSNA